MAFPKAANLTHNWQMGEASGTRADLVGGMTLTDNNTVGSAAGKVYPLAGNFIRANQERLSHAADASLDILGDWSCEFWVRLTDIPATNYYSLICKSESFYEYTCAYQQSSQHGFYLAVKDSATATYSTARFTILPTAGTWYHVVMWYTAADRKPRICVNAGAESAGVALANGPASGAAGFTIGRQQGTSNYDLNGDVGPVRMISGALWDAADRTALYNGGAGLACPSSTEYVMDTAAGSLALAGSSGLVALGRSMVALSSSLVLTGADGFPTGGRQITLSAATRTHALTGATRAHALTGATRTHTLTATEGG